MLNLNDCSENHGKKNIIINVLMDPKKRYQGRYCICNESKNTFFECTPETKPF